MMSNPSHSSTSSLGALTLGAIGVVYGDIGTSVLYALKEVFGSGHVAFTPDNVYGVLSLFFWTLTMIVSVKYVSLVLRADNHGEGGLVAMLALAAESVKHRPRLQRVLLLLGIFGTCLFYGDGVITPAISVLSAVEGLEVVSPTFTKAVIPLTLVILLGLFLVQKRGTGGIGRVPPDPILLSVHTTEPCKSPSLTPLATLRRVQCPLQLLSVNLAPIRALSLRKVATVSITYRVFIGGQFLITSVAYLGMNLSLKSANLPPILCGVTT